MIKLFIEPRHGYLGKVIDALKQANFEAKVIGWGYPPIYVEAEEKQLKEIEEIVLLEDNLAKFHRYRVDFIDLARLPEQLQKNYNPEDLRNFCHRLEIDYRLITGGGDNDMLRFPRELVNYCKLTSDDLLAKLIQVIYENRPRVIEQIIKEPAGHTS
jgi:hypothetical protein